MTNKMRVRFTFGKKSAEVDCSYGSDGSVHCITPTFSEGADLNLKMPCTCSISVTMDGVNYSDCLEYFNIYNNEIFLTSVNPKCGSVQGGSQVTLAIQIDSATAEHLADLKIGF